MRRKREKKRPVRAIVIWSDFGKQRMHAFDHFGPATAYAFKLQDDGFVPSLAMLSDVGPQGRKYELVNGVWTAKVGSDE